VSQRAQFILLCMPAHLCLMDILCLLLCSSARHSSSKIRADAAPTILLQTEQTLLTRSHILSAHLAVRSLLSSVEPLSALVPELISPIRKRKYPINAARHLRHLAGKEDDGCERLPTTKSPTMINLVSNQIRSFHSRTHRIPPGGWGILALLARDSYGMFAAIFFGRGPRHEPSFVYEGEPVWPVPPSRIVCIVWIAAGSGLMRVCRPSLEV